MELVLIVTHTMRPGAAAPFLSELAQSGILEQIRQEDGCLRYEFFLPAQGGDKLLLLEKWSTPEHQAAHMKQPHMELLSSIKDAYVLSTDVKCLHEI